MMPQQNVYATAYPPPNPYGHSMPRTTSVPHRGKSKQTAGLLALFVGGLGIHKFYLGAWGWGIIYIIFVMSFIPAIVALIEAIMYFTMSEEAFDAKWNYRNPGLLTFNRKPTQRDAVSDPSKVISRYLPEFASSTRASRRCRCLESIHCDLQPVS